MNEPRRLIEGGGTAFERELLGSVLQEPVPEHLQAQMALGLGLTPVLPSDVGLSSAFGSAAKAQVASGFGWLKLTALSLGLCAAAGAAGFGVWQASLPAASESNEPLLGQGAAAAALVAPPAPTELLTAPAGAAQAGRVGLQTGDGALAAQPAAETAMAKVNTRVERELARGRAAAAHGQEERSPAGRSAAERSIAARAAASDGVAAAASGNFVEQELRLLDPARAALKRGDVKTATRLLDEYDRRFERGALRREANVLRGLTQSK